MRQIKLLLAFVMVMIMATLSAQAQNYTNSRYYNKQTGRLDYGNAGTDSYYTNDKYFGVRIGPAFTSVSSDNAQLDGRKSKTGLNVGFIVGKSLTDSAPLYFETGLSYVEKGGQAKNSTSESNSKFTYNLDYLELPFTFKYIYPLDDDFTIQPYVGGYFALGVGGKIKDYEKREAFSSFGSGDDQFKRFDGGIRLGCGVGYDMFYAELAYDWGLSNIGHNTFDDTSNSAFYISLGVNF